MANVTATTDTIRLTRLNDNELLQGLEALIAQDHRNTAGILVHLAEVEARSLHLRRGYSSMFRYCTDALHMSEHAAYHRIEAARAARRFPVVLEFVESGKIHLTGLKLLSRHMYKENAVDLLEAASHKTRCEIEIVLAERFPQPDAVESVRRLRAPKPRKALTVPKAVNGGEPNTTDARQPAVTEQTTDKRGTCQPLAPERFKVQFTADRRLHDKLRQAQDLLRHQIPDGDIARVIDQALDDLISDVKKRRFGQTARKTTDTNLGADPATEPTRHIPNRIKRQVVQRDGERCTYVGQDGKRCTGTGWLEFHHRHVPFARGGGHSVDNVTLHCRAHNHLEGERVYGQAAMRRQL